MRAAAAVKTYTEWALPNGNDDIARVCLKHLPINVRRYINSYEVRNHLFFAALFKNGHEVAFRKSWKEFVAECILVHDLPPIER